MCVQIVALKDPKSSSVNEHVLLTYLGTKVEVLASLLFPIDGQPDKIPQLCDFI